MIDWLMVLPEALQEEFEDRKRRVEEAEAMPILSYGESKALAKGRDEGRVEGKIEGKIEALTTLIETRFGPLPDALRSAIHRFDDEASLLGWIARAASVPTLGILQAEILESAADGAGDRR